ncbi:hypothetical protein [Streptomyces sp. NPDC006309]|uniref:hypothetical protein n=1 Tax=Streptomyces sp. NPDC006309 TaxID=3156749 RepID=UPI0033BA658E
MTTGHHPGLVVKGTPPASPYNGPLYVPTRNTDGTGPRALRLASGAAGRALECDGEIFEGSGPDAWSTADGGATPREGLARYLDVAEPQDPDSGYRVERRSADRVLYSFDVAGGTKVAVVVARDQRDRPGWGPETNASCDRRTARPVRRLWLGGVDRRTRHPAARHPDQRLRRLRALRPAVGPLPPAGRP